MPSASRQFRSAGPMLLESPTDEDLQRLRQAVLGPLPRIQYIALYQDSESNYRVLAYAKNKLSPACWRTYVHPRLQAITPLEDVSNSIQLAKSSPKFEEHGSYRARNNKSVQAPKQDHQQEVSPYLLAKNYLLRTLGLATTTKNEPKAAKTPKKTRTVRRLPTKRFVRTFKYKAVTPPEHRRPDDPIEACLELTPLMV